MSRFYRGTKKNTLWVRSSCPKEKIRGKNRKDIQFEIIQSLGEISISATGWKKELNLVSWNGREPRYDLRDWAPDHQKMGKGVTLTSEELKTLKDILEGLAL